MGFAVRERNGSVLIRESKGLQNKVQRVLRAGMRGWMQALKTEANRAILKDPKTGNYYRKPNGRRYRASARGDTAHANRTGDLRRSIGYKVSGYMNATFGYGVAAKAAKTPPPYAAPLELGRGKSARPTLAKAINRVDADRYFDQAFDNEMDTRK